MGKILISGLVNIETTIRVKEFPIEYTAIEYPFFGVSSNPSGVGLNLSCALSKLGNEVKLLSFIGKDSNSILIKKELEINHVETKYLIQSLKETSNSAVLYDENGKRQIFCDLKDLQDRSYNEAYFKEAVKDCSMLCLCNVNFSRNLLPIAKSMGRTIATDVHVISDIHDEYNADFMKYSNILFLSDENIEGNVEAFVKEIANEYDNDIIVVGLGKKGALLYVKEDNFIGTFPAVDTRKVVNTIGAGDALFSGFVHYYDKNGDPYEALKKAIVFASYKIGDNGAAQGFLTENELEELYSKINNI